MNDVFDVERLMAALHELAWSQPSTWTSTKVHHGMSRAAANPDLWGWVLSRFAPVRSANLHRIAPGGFIAPHIDRGPYWERWHVPILAPAGAATIGEPRVPGVPFRVEHWRTHAVWNPTDQERVHLVIDRDIPVAVPTAPLQVFEVPAEWLSLLERAEEASNGREDRLRPLHRRVHAA